MTPVDPGALLTLSYGLYVLSSRRDEKLNGMISNTVAQVSGAPALVAVAVNKKCLTHEFIESSRLFAVSVLDEEAPMSLIGRFGFRSGRDLDKFAEVPHGTGENGCPLVEDHALAWIEAGVTDSVECGTHTLFVGRVLGARITGRGRPMTYAYYREVLQGKTPPTAPTYRSSLAVRGPEPLPDGVGADAAAKYVCGVCGWIYDPRKGDPPGGVAAGTPFETVPGDWVCPVCGAQKNQFSPVG